MNDHQRTLKAQLIRNYNTSETHQERRDPLYDTRCARLGAGTVASKLGISVDTVAPGKVSCPYHFHYAQEEAFVVLEGTGTLRVAGERLPIEAGDTIFIPAGSAYPHQIINTSAKPLKYISISTRESPEIVVYPDSNKFLARARDEGADPAGPFDRLHRLDGNLDYWDGEP